MGRPMSTVKQLPKIKKDQVLDEIQRIAGEFSGQVLFTDHAEDRMIERNITKRQVFNVLRDGSLDQGPEWETQNGGGWVCRIGWITAGKHIFVVVKLTENDDGLCDIVITAI